MSDPPQVDQFEGGRSPPGQRCGAMLRGASSLRAGPSSST